MCGEARRGCEEVCVEMNITLGCDYCVSTAICVMCFYCQAQGRLGRRQALRRFSFTGFLLKTTVSRLPPFAFRLSFDHRDDGDDECGDDKCGDDECGDDECGDADGDDDECGDNECGDDECGDDKCGDDECGDDECAVVGDGDDDNCDS